MPDTGGLSAGEAGGLVVLFSGALASIGGGVAWLFKRRDQREARDDLQKSEREEKLRTWSSELEAREKRLDAGQTEYTDKLERRLADVEAKEKARELTDEARDLQMRALRISTELLSSALRSIAPAHPALAQVDDLLRSAYPVRLGATPADLLAPLTTLHENETLKG